ALLLVAQSLRTSDYFKKEWCLFMDEEHRISWRDAVAIWIATFKIIGPRVLTIIFGFILAHVLLRILFS
ncbi:MAG: hypothetical protein LRZ93_02745, partial [Clostridiales bacterium]|nr:hypothetical protein [Clostridiales bacterium]